MSESQSSTIPASTAQRFTNAQTILFIVILSFACALILSILASALAKPKERAKDLDRSKQMMIAAKILDPNGYFLHTDAEGKLIPAKFVQDGSLQEDPAGTGIATNEQLMAMYRKRFIPLLVNDRGEERSFEQAGLKLEDYLEEYKKSGYYKQPDKLLYQILPESDRGKSKAIGYVIPVNGFGLWDAIYGYLAIKPDGLTVIGISWYDQKETPGLGANIADPPWQSLFPGKKIFQENATGKTDLKIAPLGLVVVKGKVADVYGDSVKAKSAVDGMAGATLTGNGVTDAYREVLAAYRPFLIRINKEFESAEEAAKKKL